MHANTLLGNRIDGSRWRYQMRCYLTSGLVGLAMVCTSCGKQSPAPADFTRVQWVDPATLKPGPIRHRELSAEQIQRIGAVQKVFAEVDSSPLEKWIEDFKRDMNPDRELGIWEAIAAAYVRCNADRAFSLPQRKELFGVLLTGSGASEDESIKHVKLKVLSEAEARKALRTLAEEAQAASTSFGPPIERQVRIRTWWKPAEHDVLNLDDGQLLTVPTNIVSINNPRPFLKWMANQGADLDVTTGNSLTNLSLHLDDGRLALVEGNLSFDSIAAADVEHQLAQRGVFQHQYVPTPEKGTGATLAFMTREGGMGVLKVLEFTPEAQPTVKIRYKVLQRAKRPR